jgi:NTE family protein
MQHELESRSDFRLVLVMSGGSALGAYQAGAYQALHERSLEPDWVVGASAGAVNGAVICGNPREDRVEKLEALWHVSAGGGLSADALGHAADVARRTQVAALTFASGEQDWFVPRAVYGPWWNPFANPEPASLYDASPLEKRLPQLLDFTALNAGAPRFSAAAVDVRSGEDIIFDTRTHAITPRHLRAAAALLPTFSPVEVEGRLVADAGVSANLPLDAVLSAEFDRPLLCIAIDLLPLAAPAPHGLGGTIARAQDLIFASQSRRSIAAWQAIYGERVRQGQANAVTLLHVSYADQSREVSGKAFDFSRLSAEARWRAGYRDLALALDAARSLPAAEPGLRVHALGRDGVLEAVEWQLLPMTA